jgi:hypothetical protein
MGKQLVNFITCGCEPSAPIFVIYKAGRENKYVFIVETGTWVQDLFSSILSIKCASTMYMNPFDMLRCEINAFMNYVPFP